MIDSHCHLDFEPLFNDLSNVIIRSKKIGIKKLLTICTTQESFEKILIILDKDDIIYGTFGIHPHETENNFVSIKTIIDNVKLNKKIIGVGETGLDFFYNHSDKKKQIESFQRHIISALELDCPLIIHSRNAEDQTYEILKKYEKHKLKILMHCFTGSQTFAKKLIDIGCYFSASGIITFKNSLELQNTFRSIPNERILIETDSPYLAPVPYRGKKNEPSFLQYTAKKLADIKEINVSQISEITTKNFNNLFFK